LFHAPRPLKATGDCELNLMTRQHLAAMDGSIHLRITGLKVGARLAAPSPGPPQGFAAGS
jgi:hypothetical protein